MRFRFPTRKSLVVFLLIVIAAWGVLSTTAITVFILSNDRDPTTAIIKMGVGLIPHLVRLGRLLMRGLRDRLQRGGDPHPLGWRNPAPVLLFIAFAVCWKRR